MGRRWTGRTFLFPITEKPEEMRVDQNAKEVIHEKAKKMVVEQAPETHGDNEKDQPSMDNIESEKVNNTKQTTAGSSRREKSRPTCSKRRKGGSGCGPTSDHH
eukprot:4732681-Pyramimonas_sp.AAC.1